MAFVPTPVAVTDVVTQVLAASGNRLSYNLQNTGGKSMYFSSSPEVTDLNGANPGYPLAAGAAIGVSGDCDIIYGVCSNGENTAISILLVNRVNSV